MKTQLNKVADQVILVTLDTFIKISVFVYSSVNYTIIWFDEMLGIPEDLIEIQVLLRLSKGPLDQHNLLMFVIDQYGSFVKIAHRRFHHILNKMLNENLIEYQKQQKDDDASSTEHVLILTEKGGQKLRKLTAVVAE